jgi:hypothetical protein
MSDLLDVVELAGGHLDDEVVRLVVGVGQSDAVEAVEGDGSGQREPLVPVDKGMVARKRVQQGCSLRVDGGVGVFSESRGAGPGERGFEQPDVTDLHLAQRARIDVQQVVEVEVDHWPRRSSASA